MAKGEFDMLYLCAGGRGGLWYFPLINQHLLSLKKKPWDDQGGFQKNEREKNKEIIIAHPLEWMLPKIEIFIRLFDEHFARYFESHWRETWCHTGRRTVPQISLETPPPPSPPGSDRSSERKSRAQFLRRRWRIHETSGLGRCYLVLFRCFSKSTVHQV